MSAFLIEDGVLIKYMGADAEVVIPDGVIVIGEKAFDECDTLERVVIPEGVERIEESAFEDCEHLSCVLLPSTVKEIGEKAFEDCKALTKIQLPENLRRIEKEAFSDCDCLTGMCLPYRGLQLPVAALECVEITAHNLAALLVFQRTKTAQNMFKDHAVQFPAEELAGELLNALENHETVNRCKKVAAYLTQQKAALPASIFERAEALFTKVSAQDFLR